MSVNQRLVMVLTGGLFSGGLLLGLLATEDHPNPFPWAVTAALITMALLALALWPRR